VLIVEQAIRFAKRLLRAVPGNVPGGRNVAMFITPDFTASCAPLTADFGTNVPERSPELSVVYIFFSHV
jgi:hypothetical protein